MWNSLSLDRVIWATHEAGSFALCRAQDVGYPSHMSEDKRKGWSAIFALRRK